MRKRWICALPLFPGTGGHGLQAAGGGSWAWRVGGGGELQFQPGEGRAPDGPPPSAPNKGLAGRRGPVCSALVLVEGGQEAEFQSGFTLCYPCPVPPSTPQAAFQNLGRGGPAPGEIRLTGGGSGYSRAAGEESGPSQPDTEHSGRLVSRSTWSLSWDPLGPSGLEGKERGRGWKIWGWRGPGPRVHMGQDGVWVGFFFFFFFWEGTQDFSSPGCDLRICRVTPDLHEVGWGEAGSFLSK